MAIGVGGGGGGGVGRHGDELTLHRKCHDPVDAFFLKKTGRNLMSIRSESDVGLKATVPSRQQIHFH